MKTLSESEIRSLVSLLDEDDPQNLDLVQRQILDLGTPAIPYLDELRGHCEPVLTTRIEQLAHRLHFQGLQEAFRQFASDPAPDLEKGVWLVTRFGYPGTDTAQGSAWLDAAANRIISSLTSGAAAEQIVQSLNHLLFSDMGFCGNEKHYYDPDNSYLNRVIETRHGNPVSLCVLYLLIAKRLGLPAHGVATPGHFLVGLRLNQGTSYIDAYNRGQSMTASEVRQMLARGGYEFRPEYLAPAAPRDILARILRNLVSIHQKSAQPDRAEMLSSLVDSLVAARPAVRNP